MILEDVYLVEVEYKGEVKIWECHLSDPLFTKKNDFAFFLMSNFDMKEVLHPPKHINIRVDGTI